MFAIEISYQDQSELEFQRFFILRPWALIGGTEDCNLVIEDFKELDFKILIYKAGGHKFKCQQVSKDSALNSDLLDQTYDLSTKLNLGTMVIYITNIDNDLRLRAEEPPDQAGYRLLKQALTNDLEVFPAFQYEKPYPALVSFQADQELTVGRDKEHVLRFDARDVSSKHARCGIDDDKFWIEDLGSTNGTFVNGNQVSGRVEVSPGKQIILGGSAILKGVSLGTKGKRPDSATRKIQQDLIDSEVDTQNESVVDSLGLPERLNNFPVLLSLNEVARPSRMVLQENKWVVIGRDPESDFWLGAPYVSRFHCRVRLLPDGRVEIQDTSTNGTAYSAGVIKGKESVVLDNNSEILHFGSGLAVAICFDQTAEDVFFESGGRGDAFIKTDAVLVASEDVNAPDFDVSHYEGKSESFKSVYDPNGLSGEQNSELPRGLKAYIANFKKFDLSKKVLVVLVIILIIVVLVLVVSMLWTIM